LQAIKGKGKKVDDDGWIGGVPQVDEYWTGSLSSSPTVHLQNENHENYRQPIWNVLGEIKGTDHLEEKIIIGNHRDAWCFGASDPNSGTAIMLEVARVLGKMMEFGWRPLRTIVFANWDAKEYNLIGST
jgi:N-acetylated-alpha-linked acidic dipeptidase